MADISTSTTDSNSITHLLSNSILSIQFVEVEKSEFANPSSSFTGYAADGFYYSSGSADPTVSNFKASWAEEAEHEAATSARGIVDRFPDRIFVISTDQEVVILDADDLDVWMRFTPSSSSISSATGPALGGSEAAIVSASFSEGVLFVATTKGIRFIDFLTDSAKYTTSTATYSGAGLGSRNSETFYDTDEFGPSSPDLGEDWETVDSGEDYGAGSDLVFHLPLEGGSWKDASGNDHDAVAATHGSGTSYPAEVTDSPLSFGGSPTTSMEFTNDEDSSSDFEGEFAYIEGGTDLSFPSNNEFSFSFWIKPDPDEGAWSDRSQPYQLLGKRVFNPTMRTRFGLSGDLHEYLIQIQNDGEIVVYLYKEGTSGYALTRTNVLSRTGVALIPDPSADVWTHIVITYDGTGVGVSSGTFGDAGEHSGIRIYKNGVLVSNANFPGLFPSSGQSHYVTKSYFGPWTYMSESVSPLFIGNSGVDPGGGNEPNRSKYFDGRMDHVACWSSALSAYDVNALYASASEGATTTRDDPAFLLTDECLTLSTTYTNSNVAAVVGHTNGFTSVVKELVSYPRSSKHNFTDTKSTAWTVTSGSPMVVSTDATGIDGEGWAKGDLLSLDGVSGTYSIESVSSSAVTVSSSIAAGTGGTLTVTRPVHRTLLHGSALYYTHGLSKVSKNTDDWIEAYSGSWSSINAFTAVIGTVTLPGIETLTELAYINGDIYIGSDIGVLYIDSDTFTEDSQGATLQYSSVVGDGRYQVLQGGDDGCTAMGVDPETGHLLVAVTDSDAESSVTEIDTSIHQAFQFFDANSTPAVTDSVTTMTAYRNVSGPPDVEVS